MKLRKVLVLALIMAICLSLAAGCNSGSKLAQANKDAVNLYKDIPHTKISETGITWPEGQLLPSFAPPAETVDAYKGQLSPAEDALFISLKGLVNRNKPRIISLTDSWVANLKIKYNEMDRWELLKKYIGEVKGLVVYDRKVVDTLNLATTVSGLKDLLIVDDKLANKLTAEPYNLKIVDDFRGRFKDKFEVYQYLYDTYWKDCSRRVITGLDPATTPASMRDFAIAVKSAVIYLDAADAKESLVAAKFLKDLKPVEALYMGWWPNEPAGIAYCGGQFGIPTIASDYCSNLTFYGGQSREINIPAIPKKPELKNKVYVVMMLSEGDNMQYAQHAMFWKWPDKARGQVPITWTFAPAMVDAMPQIMNYYYNDATPNDCFVTGPSGAGYISTGEWNKQDRIDKFTQLTDRYLRQSGLNVVSIWYDIHKAIGNSFAQNTPTLLGLTEQILSVGEERQRIYGGKMPAILLTPAYSGSVNDMLAGIENAAKDWDGTKPLFVGVQGNSWEISPTDLLNLSKKLDSNKYEVVRGDHFFMLYREYNGLPINVAFKNINDNVKVTASDNSEAAEKVADGLRGKESVWESSAKGEKWLKIDLGGVYNISRYMIRHAGSVGMEKSLNTKHYILQASDDGEKWTDVHVVKNNTSDITDFYLKPFNTRYLRVLIKNAGEDGVARIYEVEVHGTKNPRIEIEASDSRIQKDLGSLKKDEIVVLKNSAVKQGYLAKVALEDAFISGRHQVEFNLATRRTESSKDDDILAKIEVYDVKNEKVIATREVKHSDFVKDLQFKSIDLEFEVSEDNSQLEFRLNWTGADYMSLRRIIIK